MGLYCVAGTFYSHKAEDFLTISNSDTSQAFSRSFYMASDLAYLNLFIQKCASWIQKLLQYTSSSTGVYTERSPVAIEPMCGGWFLRRCGVPAVWLLWVKKRSLYRSSGACHRPECTNHAAPRCIVRKQWPKALSPWNSLYKQRF